MLFWLANNTKIDQKEPAPSKGHMVTIYQDYDDEPEDIFLPLPEPLACSFYALEMNDVTADIAFYLPRLPRHGPILELGCGTGRITRRLAETVGHDRLLVGIDISLPMLREARQASNSARRSPCYLAMDMTQLGFTEHFAALLIPYNTLNLLGTEKRILSCLGGCKNVLQRGGRLLVELFVPGQSFIDKQKSFQFQMFNRPEGGKIIKEIRKTYLPHSQSIRVEERYRVRPMQAGQANEDWQRIFTIAGFSADRWLALFHQAGLPCPEMFGDYCGNHYDQALSSTLLAICTL